MSFQKQGRSKAQARPGNGAGMATEDGGKDMGCHTDTTAMARLLDALRGGANWPLDADARTAETVMAFWPAAPRMIERYDSFRSGVAEAAVVRGMTAVVFGAGGFPSGDAPHRAAAAASATARFWYPEADGAIAGQRALSLDGDDRAAAFKADVRDPAGLLKGAGLLDAAGTGWLGEGPCQVQWGLAAMVMDDGEAAALAGEYGKLLPSGSELVIAVPNGDEGRRFTVLAGACPHTGADLARWCEGAGLGLDGPSDVRAWGREVLGEGLRGHGGRIVVAVARVP